MERITATAPATPLTFTLATPEAGATAAASTAAIPPGSTLLGALGGLGLFLLGMSVMTEGLRSLAGQGLRKTLLRFTSTPLSGALTGAATTAVLQSSSATTVATVGFVGAGLISFPASIGIIFGSNVGSTGLGWLVALVGLKLQLGQALVPLVLIGTALRMFGRGRLAQAGFALAGFGVLFMGIDAIKAAIGGHGLLLDPVRFAGDTMGGRLQLVLLGLVSTIITQSSGAGVAASLTALSAGAITLTQAASLVVGMDVGTTITAVLAALGGSLSARRTAAAHVIFNLFTATLALSLITPMVSLWTRWFPAALAADPEFALTSFHTGFNLIGVTVLLPFTVPFARIVRWLLPSTGRGWADQMELTPPSDVGIALDQVERALRHELLELLAQLHRFLAPGNGVAGPRPLTGLELQRLQADLDLTETYLLQIDLGAMDASQRHRLVHHLHGLDHLQRLHERCDEEPERAATVSRSDELGQERAALLADVAELRNAVQGGHWTGAHDCASELDHALSASVQTFRRRVLEQVAGGHMDLARGNELLEAMRWLDRISHHLERITHHLEESR